MEKENYAIKVNALKYQNSGVMNIKGRTGTKRFLLCLLKTTTFLKA